MIFVVFVILFTFVCNATTIVQWFDRKHEFTTIAVQIFPYISIFAFFDVLQLVLSGALRGASNVRTVMYSRLGICLLYFLPVSYCIANLALESVALKLLLLFGSFYMGNALLSFIYIRRFRSEVWKHI